MDLVAERMRKNGKVSYLVEDHWHDPVLDQNERNCHLVLAMHVVVGVVVGPVPVVEYYY